MNKQHLCAPLRSAQFGRAALILCLALAPGLTGCAADTVGDDVSNVEDRGDSARLGKFEIFQGEDEQYYFHLKAANGEIILASEGYVSKQGAENGVASVEANAVDLAQFEIREADSDDDQRHYFVLKAKNHEIIGVSEMYASASNAKRGTETVNEVVVKMLRHEAAVSGGAGFDLFESDASGEYYFNLKAANGEIVLASEGYTRKASARNGIESVRTNGKDLENYDILQADSEEEQFYFVLKARNHQVIGVSEMYVSKSNAQRGAETVADLLYSERVADAE